MKERLPRNRRHGLKKRESAIHAEKELKFIFLAQRLSPSREITTACQESRNRRYSACLWSFLWVGQRAIAAIFPPSPAQRAARFANTIGGRPTVEQSVTKSRPPHSRPRLKPSRKKKGLLCAGGVRSKNGPKPTQSLVAGTTWGTIGYNPSLKEEKYKGHLKHEKR